jgi:hypothetical protein
MFQAPYRNPGAATPAYRDPGTGTGIHRRIRLNSRSAELPSDRESFFYDEGF